MVLTSTTIEDIMKAVQEGKTSFSEKMLTDMLKFLVDDEHINRFTFLDDEFQLREIYKAQLVNRLVYQSITPKYLLDKEGKPIKNPIRENGRIKAYELIENPEYDKYTKVLNEYKELKMSIKGKRSEEIVRMFNGLQNTEQNFLGGIGRGISNILNRGQPPKVNF